MRSRQAIDGRRAVRPGASAGIAEAAGRSGSAAADERLPEKSGPARAFLRAVVLILLCLALSACSFFRSSPVEKVEKPAAPVSKIVETVKSQIGKPYHLAGDSPRTGFDCSGLVQWAYAQNGIGLPRRSTDQYQTGKPVSRSALSPGDLVFFQFSHKRNASLHVGIYAGDGQFIHSPSSGGRVRQEHLDAAPWNAVYLGAKRVAP